MDYQDSQGKEGDPEGQVRPKAQMNIIGYSAGCASVELV